MSAGNSGKCHGSLLSLFGNDRRVAARSRSSRAQPVLVDVAINAARKLCAMIERARYVRAIARGFDPRPAAGIQSAAYFAQKMSKYGLLYAMKRRRHCARRAGMLLAEQRP
jgi:hypothetical protein